MSTHNHSIFRPRVLTALALAAIILLGAFLRFYQLGATGVGNEYYAATVKSMLTSWHNFFFVAFEPGGSVTVDKPPLGFWLEALSAYFLGVTGFALALPNALAGTLAIPLLYSMLRKQFGVLAGLSAALVLASTPVTIAAERNNTIDGMLVFVLLLAAWAVWRSVESGQFRYLLLGAFIVGLGFNIKMLQAYMVLPALYALYFFGAKHGWGRRILHLGAATVLLLIVSFSWALIVDAVPADSRPFIGSSTDNTVSELIVGHNGIKRLLGGSGPGGGADDRPLANNPQPDDGGKGAGPALGFAPPRQNRQPGQPPMQPGGPNQANRPGGSNEVGEAGLLRLFSEPLASEASWLMPLALLGLGLTLAVLGRPLPLTGKHLALILWAGWLLPVILYFSFTTGLWHTYYLIMIGPALAALVGATVWALDVIASRRSWAAWQSSLEKDNPVKVGIASAEEPRLAMTQSYGWGLAALLSGITLGFEIFVLSAYPTYFAATSALMIALWLAGMALLWFRPQTWALGLVLVSLLVAPLFWSGLTSFNPQPNVSLPHAGPAMQGQPAKSAAGELLSPTQQKVLDYLLANTAPDAYLAATLDSHGASPFILATGRAVLTFGGFNGGDNVIDLAGLQEMLASGELRFILDNGNLSQKAEIFAWVQTSCQVAQVPGLAQNAQPLSQGPGGPRDQQFTALYDCGN
ncbi:MAG: hypothetical protein CVU44_11630 [Chloroflexi bacterium HGW-Chloroflexi-6]|nr:MAG: hypothetical protein CVU44_11630 [Chloroflexi bacterium HGW-Chloroflexi-6]